MNMESENQNIDDFIAEEVGEFNPTMKLNPTNETDIEFKECGAVISNAKLQKTKNGNKVILTLEDEDSDFKFDIFANKTSLAKLKSQFGESTKEWKEKKVKLSKTKDAQFKKDMILVTPLD